MNIYIESSQISKLSEKLTSLMEIIGNDERPNYKNEKIEFNLLQKILEYFKNNQTMFVFDNSDCYRKLVKNLCKDDMFSILTSGTNVPNTDNSFVSANAPTNSNQLKSIFIVETPQEYRKFGVIAFNIDELSKIQPIFASVNESFVKQNKPSTTLTESDYANNECGWNIFFNNISTNFDDNFLSSNSIIISDPYIFQSFSKKEITNGTTISKKSFGTFDFVLDILDKFLPNELPNNNKYQITILSCLNYKNNNYNSEKDYCYDIKHNDYTELDYTDVTNPAYNSTPIKIDTSSLSQPTNLTNRDIEIVSSHKSNWVRNYLEAKIRTQRPNLNFDINVILKWKSQIHDRYIITNNIHLSASSGFQYETLENNVNRVSYFYPFFADNDHKNFYDECINMVKNCIQTPGSTNNQIVIDENRLFS